MSNIVQVPASTANYTTGRLGYKVSGIIIHTMVGTMSATDGTFANPARGASAHYGIPYNGYADSPIHQYVAEGNIAWHCGRFYPDASNPLANVNTVGIEHADNGAYNSPRPDGLYDVSSQLVREICARYGIPIDRNHIRKHNEVSVLVTGCPDSLDIDRIVAMAAGPIPTPQSPEEDMIYVGVTHPKVVTLKAFVAGFAYRERSASSPSTPMSVGASTAMDSYCYSTSPVQSSDLGGGVAGPDYLWWHGTNGLWYPDAYLDTSVLTGAPTPGIPTTETLNLLFALAGSGGTVGPKGDKGDQGLTGLTGATGPKGDIGATSTIPGPQGPPGVVPDHKHGLGTTGPMVV